MSESRAEADIPKYVNDFLLYFQVAPGYGTGCDLKIEQEETTYLGVSASARLSLTLRPVKSYHHTIRKCFERERRRDPIQRSFAHAQTQVRIVQ